MDRSQKEALVTELKADFASAGIVLIAQQTGLNAQSTLDLRIAVRNAGASFKVVKNSLASLAFKDTPYEGLNKMLTGPSCFAYSESPVAAAKAIHKFAEDNNNLKIIGGAMGDKLLSANDIKALATLPDLDTLRSQIIGVVQAPATKVATVISAPLAQLARVFSAYAKSKS